MGIRIPFNRPCLTGNEYKYIAEAIASATPREMVRSLDAVTNCSNGSWKRPKFSLPHRAPTRWRDSGDPTRLRTGR